MAESGYGAKTTGISENTTGISPETLGKPLQMAVALTRGVPTKGSDGLSIGVNGEDFKCVDTSKLTDLTGQLKESDYKCASPSHPEQTFRATVKHGPTGPK